MALFWVSLCFGFEWQLTIKEHSVPVADKVKDYLDAIVELNMNGTEQERFSLVEKRFSTATSRSTSRVGTAVA
jgi:hypothetical protein